MNKQKIEERHLNQFISLLTANVKTFSINPTPEPDFTLFLDSQRIGVEHTRLFLGVDDKGDNIVIHNKVADTILNDAFNLFSATNTEKLTVVVSFVSSYGLAIESKMLSRKDIKVLSKFISDFVKEHIPQKGVHARYNQFDFTVGKYILPNKILSISIWHKYSSWTASKAGMVPSIQGESLAFRVFEKDKKPKNYKGSYDEIWLLLVEDQWNMETYFDFDDLDSIQVSSIYNKVYLLRSGNNHLYEIHNELPHCEQWQSRIL